MEYSFLFVWFISWWAEYMCFELFIDWYVESSWDFSRLNHWSDIFISCTHLYFLWSRLIILLNHCAFLSRWIHQLNLYAVYIFFPLIQSWQANGVVLSYLLCAGFLNGFTDETCNFFCIYHGAFFFLMDSLIEYGCCIPPVCFCWFGFIRLIELFQVTKFGDWD